MGRVHLRMHREVEEILAREKSIASVDTQYFASEDWMNLLLGSEEIRSEAVRSPDILEHLLPAHCYAVLSAHPEMIPHCNEKVWEKLGGKHLLALFCPKYDPACNWEYEREYEPADNCENDQERARKHAEEVAAKCDEFGVWTKFRHGQIFALLKEYPEYADRLILPRLDREEWRKLLMLHPEVLQFYKKDASNRRYHHKTFQYWKFVDAVKAAEKVEKETGAVIVKKYAAWTCFDFNDWKKLRYLDSEMMERYYGKLFLDESLLNVMTLVVQSPEDWQNRYAWEFWECRRLEEKELEQVCAFLKVHPELREITPLYKTMLDRFRSARRSWQLESARDTVALYHRLVEQYQESCPDLTAIIIKDGLPPLWETHRRTDK